MAEEQDGSERRRDPTMWGLLDRAADLERRVGALYDRWAELFRHLPLVAAFWREMAGEERLHALIVGAAREVFPPTAPALPGAWNQQLEGIEKLLADIESELSAEASLEKAFARADELESSELDTLRALIVEHAGTRFSRLAPLVGSSGVDRHREKVLQAQHRFCSAESPRRR